jgi:hypothetical protein
LRIPLLISGGVRHREAGTVNYGNPARFPEISFIGVGMDFRCKMFPKELQDEFWKFLSSLAVCACIARDLLSFCRYSAYIAGSNGLPACLARIKDLFEKCAD